MIEIFSMCRAYVKHFTYLLYVTQSSCGLQELGIIIHILQTEIGRLERVGFLKATQLVGDKTRYQAQVPLVPKRAANH